jgi:hypothetical protein
MKSKAYYSSALYDVARSINSSLELSQVLDCWRRARQGNESKPAPALLSADKSLLVMGEPTV